MHFNGEAHLLGIVKDIEEFKRTQEALVRSEELFRKYFELGLVGMAIASPEKAWMYVNDRICELLGYTREELLQTTRTDRTHHDDLESDLAQFKRMLAGEIVGYSLHKRFLRIDGTMVYTTLHATCMRNQDGSVERVIAHLHDISDRIRAEETLKDNAERYRSLFGSANDAIFVMEDRTFIECNSKALEMIGCQDISDLAGRTRRGYADRFHVGEHTGGYDRMRAVQLHVLPSDIAVFQLAMGDYPR